MAKVKSINKAQQELLAEGFLDAFGEDKEGITLLNTSDAMSKLAAFLLEETVKNLKDSTASGALASSFAPTIPRRVGKDVVVDIEALVYWQFINRGVKGTKKGSGEFAFKSPYPSKKMVEAIRKWMKASGKAQSNMKSSYKSISKLEVKRKSVAQLDGAYAVARSIKQNGIKKTNYFDKAFQTTSDMAAEKLGVAFKLDIINSLPDTLNDGN